jgi:hypothetical protein
VNFRSYYVDGLSAAGLRVLLHPLNEEGLQGGFDRVLWSTKDPTNQKWLEAEVLYTFNTDHQVTLLYLFTFPHCRSNCSFFRFSKHSPTQHFYSSLINECIIYVYYLFIHTSTSVFVPVFHLLFLSFLFPSINLSPPSSSNSFFLFFVPHLYFLLCFCFLGFFSHSPFLACFLIREVSDSGIDSDIS